MGIPKQIFQTFKTDKLPWITRLHRYFFLKKNKDYAYYFYDDHAIEKFILEEFPDDLYPLYSKVNIGAMKADIFRYAILYKKGGIYLDIDSKIRKNLDQLITKDDVAILSLESSKLFYIQWALIFESGHPFLKKTLQLIIENLKNKPQTGDIHQLTGPTVFTSAIQQVLKENPSIPYRIYGTDYNGFFQFKYLFANKLLYGWNNHWKKVQRRTNLMQNDD